jgi:hypothetical protein
MRKVSLKRKIAIGFLVVIVAAVIVVHTYFAGWLLHYINRTLNNIPGYQGSVQSINIDLYRSAYRINKLVLNKKEGTIPTPFVAIDVVDFSLEWSALLHGRIVSNATLTHPVVNFAVNKDVAQNGAGVDWTKPIKDLMPIDINHVLIKDGSVTYQDFAATPQVDIYIRHLDGEMDNLRNVQNPNQALPSSVAIRGSSIGNGNLSLKGRMNILNPMPDMDMYLALEKVDLPALNNYSEAYASFDFKSGTFDLYSQFNVKDNNVSGYVKPMVTHLEVDVLKKPNPVQVAWSTVMAAILRIFTNPSKDQFATQIPLEGDLKNVSANTWSALGGIIYNAFIQAMNKGFDENGQKGDISPPAQK